MSCATLARIAAARSDVPAARGTAQPRRLPCCPVWGINDGIFTSAASAARRCGQHVAACELMQAVGNVGMAIEMQSPCLRDQRVAVVGDAYQVRRLQNPHPALVVTVLGQQTEARESACRSFRCALVEPGVLNEEWQSRCGRSAHDPQYLVRRGPLPRRHLAALVLPVSHTLGDRCRLVASYDDGVGCELDRSRHRSGALLAGSVADERTALLQAVVVLLPARVDRC